MNELMNFSSFSLSLSFLTGLPSHPQNEFAKGQNKVLMVWSPQDQRRIKGTPPFIENQKVQISCHDNHMIEISDVYTCQEFGRVESLAKIPKC